MKKIILLLSIISIFPLFAQEKEVISPEPKKWGATVGIYNGRDRMPMLNAFYGINEWLNFSLSLRKRDIRRNHELIDYEAYQFSRYRYDTWRDSFSSRNVIAPGVELHRKDSAFYLTIRLGLEDYRYNSHTERLFFAEGRGYTSYRTYQVKSYRQNQFAEVGGGIRYLFWNTILLGAEVGFQKIFHTKYGRTQFDDFSFYQGYGAYYNQIFYSTDPEMKTTSIYVSLSLGIAF